MLLPIISATKTDTISTDADSDGRADPGDTLKYTVTITNGGTDGISLQNNTSETRTFGTLGVSGSSGNAFLHANGGGNVTITGAETLSSAGAAVTVVNPGATNVINFQRATGATITGAGDNGVEWIGVAGATITFNSMSIQTNGGNALVASGGGSFNFTNGTGTINASSQTAPAIIASKYHPEREFLSNQLVWRRDERY